MQCWSVMQLLKLFMEQKCGLRSASIHQSWNPETSKSSLELLWCCYLDPTSLQQEEIYTEIPAGVFHKGLIKSHFPSDRFIQHFWFMLPRRHDLWEGLLSDLCCIFTQQELISSPAWSEMLLCPYFKAFHRSHSWPGRWDSTGTAWFGDAEIKNFQHRDWPKPTAP